MHKYLPGEKLEEMLSQTLLATKICDIIVKYAEPLYMKALNDGDRKSLNDLYPYAIEWDRERERHLEEARALEAAIKAIKATT